MLLHRGRTDFSLHIRSRAGGSCCLSADEGAVCHEAHETSHGRPSWVFRNCLSLHFKGCISLEELLVWGLSNGMLRCAV
jgi:hypothetical protein